VPHTTLEKLINSDSINIALGRQYFNHNDKLYLKILKNFVTRFEILVLDELEEKEIQNTLHLLKGLCATLGMSSLSIIIQKLEKELSAKYLYDFSQEMINTIKEIKNIS